MPSHTVRIDWPNNGAVKGKRAGRNIGCPNGKGDRNNVGTMHRRNSTDNIIARVHRKVINDKIQFNWLLIHRLVVTRLFTDTYIVNE